MTASPASATASTIQNHVGTAFRSTPPVGAASFAAAGAFVAGAAFSAPGGSCTPSLGGSCTPSLGGSSTPPNASGPLRSVSPPISTIPLVSTTSTVVATR